MKVKAWMVVPAVLVLAACDSGNGGGGGGGGGSACGDGLLNIDMAVTGELTPQYSWGGGAARDLNVTRVENLEFIASNPTACAGTATPDERCEIAYTITGVTANNVNSPTTHGNVGSPPATLAVTQENPLEMGVLYQMTVNRINESGGGLSACGCLRFTAGTPAEGDGNCG